MKMHNSKMMQRIFLCLLCCVLIASSFQVYTHADTLRYALITPLVNVRNATSVKADVIYVIEAPGEFLILSETTDAEDNLWYKIEINSSTKGWVASWVIDSVRSSEKETPVSNLTILIDPGVKIRTRPSLSAPVHHITTEQISKIVVAKINDENNRTWYKIPIESNQFAWVASWVVTTETEEINKKSASDKLIICNSINVRKGPGTEYPVVYYVSSHLEARGIYVEQDSNGKDWYSIRLPNNIEGWVAGWVVDIKNWSDQKQQVTNRICCIEPVVNIRSGPSTNSSIITTVDTYGEFEVLFQSKDINGKIWYEIRLDTGTGWVAGWVVDIKSTGKSNETLEAVNVRSGPGIHFDKCFEMPAHTAFTVQGSYLNAQQERWYLILMGGKTGWVFGELVYIKTPPYLKQNYINKSVSLKNSISVPFYDGPGEEYKQLLELPVKAGSVRIIGIAQNAKKEMWFELEYKKTHGWIHEKWINVDSIDPSVSTEQYRIQSISWSKKQDGILMQLIFDKEGLFPFESFQLQDPSRSIIEIKNCTLFQDESVQIVNTNGIKDIHAFQFSTHPNIVRIAVECTTDMRFVSDKSEKSLLFNYMNYANYAGPKLSINGKELENQLLLKEYKGHLYVPLQELSQTIDGFVSWDDKNQQAVLQLGKTTYGFTSGHKNVYIKATREDRIDINNPIQTFDSILYLPIADCGTIFNTYLYAIGSHYFLDNRLNSITTESKSGSTIFEFDFAFPMHYQIQKDSDRASIILPDTALSTNLKPPSCKEWIKASSVARSVNTPSKSTIVLSTSEYASIESATIPSDNRLIITLKPDQAKGLKNRTIIIDPGHGSFTEDGYYDAGAIGPTGLLESAVNLKIALKLQEMLEAKGAKVILTRNQEQNGESPDLKQRLVDANASGADLFISIHQNASQNHSLKGIQSFFWNDSSKEIATSIAEAISKETGLSVNQVSQRNLSVTQNITSMPSILIETACLSNPEEEKMLQSDTFLGLIAEGMLKAIESYFL